MASAISAQLPSSYSSPGAHIFQTLFNHPLTTQITTLSRRFASGHPDFPHLDEHYTIKFQSVEVRDIEALGFEKTMILWPGLIVGDRVEYNRHGLHERPLMGIASFAGSWTGGMAKDFWAQDAQVIRRAAVIAGLRAVDGVGPGVWIMNQGGIVRLGRTEWKD